MDTETEFWEDWRAKWRKTLERLLDDIDGGEQYGLTPLEEMLELAMEHYGEPGRN